MYRTIWNRLKSSISTFPDLRRPLVGAVIKEIRVDKGIKQKDFAAQIQMKEPTLKSIENDRQNATTVKNLEKCANALGITVDELILMGRDRDPTNYFICKDNLPPPISGIKERKKSPPLWRKRSSLHFENFSLTPISPPIATKKDFFFCKISLPPGNSIKNLKMSMHEQVMGFISDGFNLKINYDGRETNITANQGFALDAFHSHEIINGDKKATAVIYLVTRFPHCQHDDTLTYIERKHLDALNIAHGIEYVRKLKSERQSRLLSIRHLCDLTDSLNRKHLTKLMRFKKGSSVIYWDKIEDLLSSVGVSLDDFLRFCHNEEKRSFFLATADTRALIEYRVFGMRIYSAAAPLEKSDYFLGELQIEPKGGEARKTWERKDNAMISIYVEDGELEVTVGKYRGPIPILKNESIYFDGNLGYSLRNPGEKKVRGMIATYPTIQL